MNDKRLMEELSAYLDGEADDPEALARMIQRDEAVARRYMELAKLSSHLKAALREPDVPPAFATRVLARVRETERLAAPALRWAWLRMAPALAAGIVLCLAGLYWLRPSGDMVSNDGQLAEVLELRRADPDALMGELERAIAQQDRFEMAAVDFFSLTDMDDDVPVEYPAERGPMIAANGNAMAYDETTDLSLLLDSLSDSEAQAFRELLFDYAEEGLTTL